MKKILTLISFLGFSQVFFSQQLEDSVYHLSIMKSIGSGNLSNNTIGVMNGNYSKIGLQLDIRLYKDTFLDDVFLSLGLGYSEFNSNYYVNNESLSLKNNYVDVPIMVNFKKYLNDQKSLIFFISGGISINHLLNSKSKSLTENFDYNVNGFNAARVGRVGFEYIFSNNYYLGIAYQDFNDWSSINKNGISNELNNVSCLNISIGFRK